MDHYMPVLTGPEATKKIRNGPYAETIIIGITGNSTIEEATEYLAEGVDDVLVKPVSVSSIKKSVVNAMKNRNLKIASIASIGSQS